METNYKNPPSTPLLKRGAGRIWKPIFSHEVLTGHRPREVPARGVDFGSGNPFRRAKNIVPILTPPFHGVFQRADDLAVAPMAGGYVSGAKRTHLHELRIASEDYWVLGAVLELPYWRWKFKYRV
jgi:hypothetical protein